MANLLGQRLPNIDLAATNNTSVNLSKLSGTAVVFCYPFTGRPGYPNPQGWDDIPGAHGSTPQALGFSKLYEKFATLEVKIFGLSFQATEWQQDFAARNALPFVLLSDETQNFSRSLKLHTFQANGKPYLTRRCFIIENNIIKTDLYPVQIPEHNAAEILSILQQ